MPTSSAVEQLEETDADADANIALFRKHYPGVTFDAGEVGGVPVEWITPTTGRTDDLVVVYLHGGGLVSGVADMTRLVTSRLAEGLRVKVVAPNYRLAPQHAFPAQQDDVLAVYEELLRRGYAGDRIVVAGDSAGANLAVTLAADARDRGIALPGCLLLNSPYADVALLTPSLDDPVKNRHWIKRSMVETLAGAYLSTGGVDAADPRLSSVYRDLTGLPPMLVQAAGFDVCHDDAVRLASSARAVGVPVTFTEYPDSEHIFIIFGSIVGTDTGVYESGYEPDACRRAANEMVAFVRENVPGVV